MKRMILISAIVHVTIVSCLSETAAAPHSLQTASVGSADSIYLSGVNMQYPVMNFSRINTNSYANFAAVSVVDRIQSASAGRHNIPQEH